MLTLLESILNVSEGELQPFQQTLSRVTRLLNDSSTALVVGNSFLLLKSELSLVLRQIVAPQSFRVPFRMKVDIGDN